jgi:hypothetical protein
MIALVAVVFYLLGFAFWLGVCRGRLDPWRDAALFAAFWPLGAAWHRAKFGRFAALLLLALVAAPARAAYIKTILQDPTHPRVSAGLSFNSKLELDGGGTAVALVYHEADREDSLIPNALLDLGIRPVSWAIQGGVGGDTKNVIIPFGASANLTPTVLGPALDLMRRSSSPTAQTLAKILDSPAGGVAFGPQWTAKPVRDGVILPLNSWRFPPGWFVGGLWRFL